MPTYDYECTHCKYKFELSQEMSAEPLKKCPKCNKKVKRLIGSGSGIIFKGHGFYATDYRKKPKTESKAEKTILVPQKEAAMAVNRNNNSV